MHAKRCRTKVPGSQEWPQTWLPPPPWHGHGHDFPWREGEEGRDGDQPWRHFPTEPGTTGSRKRLQREPKASGISDAPQTQPWQPGCIQGWHSPVCAQGWRWVCQWQRSSCYRRARVDLGGGGGVYAGGQALISPPRPPPANWPHNKGSQLTALLLRP